MIFLIQFLSMILKEKWIIHAYSVSSPISDQCINHLFQQVIYNTDEAKIVFVLSYMIDKEAL